MTPSQVAIGIPTRGAILAPLVMMLLKIQDHRPEILFLIEAGHLSVSDTRHRLVNAFLKTNREALLMIDDDVVPPATLIQFLEAAGTWDVVSAPYPVFRSEYPVPFPYACNWDEKAGCYRFLPNLFTSKGLVEVDAATTGCMLVRRETLEGIERPFDVECYPDGTIHYTDDVAFCRRVRASGRRIAVNFDHPSEHYPNHVPLRLLHSRYEKVYADIDRMYKRQVVLG